MSIFVRLHGVNRNTTIISISLILSAILCAIIVTRNYDYSARGSWTYYSNNSPAGEQEFATLNLLENGKGNFYYIKEVNSKSVKVYINELDWKQQKKHKVLLFISSASGKQKLFFGQATLISRDTMHLVLSNSTLRLTLIRRGLRRDDAAH